LRRGEIGDHEPGDLIDDDAGGVFFPEDRFGLVGRPEPDGDDGGERQQRERQ